MPNKNNHLICACNNVGKIYGDFIALKNVNLSIQKGEKIGLVGANGAGKSTLLKILSGIIENDTGTVFIPKDIKVAYIPQDFVDFGGLTVKGFIQSLENKDHILSDNIIFPVLDNLNLGASMLSRKLSSLSGGEKTKVALLRILLSNFDFYLLDEPTNNLDLYTFSVLEKFVKESHKTFFIVSHDREFLDKIVHKVVEIDDHSREMKIFDGNFTDYITEKEHLIERQWVEYSEKVKNINKLKIEFKAKEKWMKSIDQERLNIKKLPIHEKNKPHAADLRDKAGRMGHRLKVVKNKIERFIEKTKKIEKPREPLGLKVNFEIDKRSGDKIFDLKSVVKSMTDRSLGPIDLKVQYGERILITGENGAGKSTLLKIMLKEIEINSGKVDIGSNVTVGYLPQQEDFVSGSTVISEFLRHVEVPEGIGRRLLNRFRITEDDVKKKINKLSSGERSRLILAIIMARKVNCLVLDEPSNHLDLEVLESFEKALKDFKGTLIVVSHDRYFVKNVGFEKIFVLKNGNLYHRE